MNKITDLLNAVNTKTETTTVAKKVYKFTAILTDYEAKAENGKIRVRMNFNITGHPFRETYTKEVSVNYLNEVLPLLNRYVKTKTENLDVLLEQLIKSKTPLNMWSSSYFDKAKDKYITDAGFIEKK